MIFAILQIDRDTIINSFSQVPIGLTLALLFFQVFVQLLLNYQWFKIARISSNDISFWDMFYINSQGAIIETITPGAKIGGELTRTIKIKKATSCATKEAAAIVALQKIFSMGAFLIILIFAVTYLILNVDESFLFFSVYAQLSIYGIIFLCVVFLCAIIFAPSKLILYVENTREPRFLWLKKIRGFFLVLLCYIMDVRQNKNWVQLGAISLAIWLFYPLRMYMLVMLFYPEPQVLYIIAITFVAYMVAMLPIFPGGLGGFEGTMSALLVVKGLTLSDAVVVSLLFRFVTFWFVMALSLVFIIFYRGYKVSTRRT